MKEVDDVGKNSQRKGGGRKEERPSFVMERVA
jgi:hypothetical protein